MTRWLLLLALVACGKGKESKPHAGSGSGSRLALPATCEKALDRAAAAPLDARPKILIDNCQVCPGWNTLMTWNVEGTKPEDVQKALEGCNAFCTGDSKMKFVAAADKAKGTSNDTPWRKLAEACGDRVDASTDHRFMSAPYFALDRIARTAAPTLAAKLDAIVLPLPALTVAGTGLVLPELDTGTTPKVGELAITLIGDEIYVGKLPRAKLGKDGVIVELGDPAYPGKAVKLADLASALTAVVGADKTQTVTLLAPHAMPAEKLVPIVAAAGTIAPLYLGAAAEESPVGWQLPGAIPYALQVGNSGIKVTGEMTVQNLATELAAKRSGTLQQ